MKTHAIKTHKQLCVFNRLCKQAYSILNFFKFMKNVDYISKTNSELEF